MMKKFTKLLVGLLLLVLSILPKVQAATVDEPVGAMQRPSLGLTLWHLGHSATYIGGFHNYLTAHGIDPLTLDPPANSSTVSTRLLLEPELLPTTNLNIYGAGWAWTTNDMSIHSSVHDPGAGSPAVSMPLTIPLAGRYRLWVRYYGFTSGYGPTSFKMYKNGAETNGPALYEEIYDVATPTEGWYWKDVIVDLTPGTYTIYLAHEGHGWRDTPGGANGYSERNIDCIYLTDELWAAAPSDTARQDIRNGARSGIQWTVNHSMTADELNSWRLWQVRPVAWEEQAAKPSVFTQSHAYWRSVVDSLATPDYGNNPPSFRSANRQNIFDARWNMMANPVRIARQAATLQGDILPPDSPKLNEKYYWMMGNQFDQFTGSGWYIDGTTLTAGWGGFDGVASHDYTIDVPGTYYVWVHFAYNWVFGPWYMTVSNAQNQAIRFDYYTNNLPGGASETWQRFTSTIPVTSPGNLHISVAVPQDPEIYRNGSTYRWIKDVLITTDADYVPQGTVRPPISAAQYAARAQGLGAGTSCPYFLWLPGNAYDPILQDQWPAEAVPPGNASKALSMVRNTHRAVHVPMRSIVSNAVTLNVSPGVLQGAAGTYANQVTWRVVSYNPYSGGYDRQGWTPFVLLQRPDITIPPYNMAALWLDIDSTGVAPGDYTCDVVLSGAATPNRTVTLNVHVSAVDTSTANPVLLGGWTPPPEGEIYTQDYTAHGMTIWYGEMSKAEMVARGIKLLSIGIWWGDQTYISGIVNRLLSMGLSYDDFVFSVMDEPNGSTQAELQNYIDIATAIHAANPNVRVSFNPGEAASLATFQVLNPYCQVWLPFALHTSDPAKMAIITSKPWMWYITPDLWDKSPFNPNGMYGLARWIPAQPTNCIGAAFFAFNYMWRDHWDVGYEVVVDEEETVLPSRNGPVPTRVWDAIREGTQDAKLGFLVKQKLGGVLNTTEQSFVANSKTEELISWLEHPVPARPTFSLAVAIYPEGQTQMVTIASTTSGALIRYTTDGSTPSATVGTLYAGPVPLSSTTVLKAIAYKSGLYDSAVASVTYTFLPPCTAPTFAPTDGSYSLYFGGQAVTLSSATSGATIRYTTDGSTPSPTVGTVYTGAPIPFSTMPVRLKAIAYKSGMADSPVAPFHGTCSIWTKMNVMDALADGASLYDGKVLPSVGDLANASNGYLPTLFASGGPVVVKSGANTLSGHQGLYFPSGAKLDAGSGGGTGIDGGNYQTVAFVFKTVVDNCVLFRDGSWGLVIKDGKLRFAVRSYNGGHWGGWACDPWLSNPSSLGSNVTNPTLVTDGNVHTVVIVVSSSALNLYVDGVGASASMNGYYGQAPGNQGNSISIGSCPRDGSGPCAAEAAMANMFTGSIGEIITFQNPFASTEAQALDLYLRNFNAACSTPTFSPTPGTYTGAQSVTINSATSGATIRYTVDGSTPSPTVGTVYTAPVSISADTTLKAIAYKTGLADSAVASGAYTIQSATCSLWTKMSAIDSYADGFTLVDWTMLPSFGTLTNASNGFLPKLFTLGSPVVAKNGANTLNGHQAIYFPTGAKLDAGTGGGTGIDGGNYQTVSFIFKTTVNNCVLFRDNTVVGLVVKNGKLRLAIRNYNGGHWGGWACDPWLSDPAYLGPNVTHPTSVTDGNIHTVVIVVTPTALSLYVDGVGSSVSLNGYYGQPPANQGNSISFGSCSKDGSSSCAAETPMANNFSGSIGEVMTYQNSFSDNDAQATDLYLKQKYGVQQQCAAPSYSPVAGTYSNAQSVTISTATSGATIRYTVDGSTPSSTAGTVYSAPVEIGSNTTLKAMAYKSGAADSSVASGTYTIIPANPIGQVIADSINDFSTTQGANNWYYGYYDKPSSALFVQDNWDAGNSYWKGTEDWCLLSASWGHPGSTDWSVRRWVAETTGAIHITGTLAKTDVNGGDGVIGHILLNGVDQWSQAISYNDSVGVNYSLDLNVVAGDYVDFAIDPNGYYSYDSSKFTAIITGAGSEPGLVAHWKLDESSGATAADSSSYGHNGTLVNGPTWVTGQIGGAVQLAGGSQYIVADNVAVNTTGGGCNTVTFWMKWDGTENQMPFGWNGLYDLWFNSGSFGINTAQSDIYGIASTGLAGQWVHVAVVFPNGVPSAANAKIYINGAQQTITQRMGSSVARTATPGVLISGWGNDGNYKFNGTIDDVRIYNRELSAGEVAALGAVGTGYISREVWTGVGGNSVADIPVSTTPAISDTLTNMETPTDWLDNYGTRLRGYITAPASGSYTFWVASDDNSELWLSANDQPANKVLIASVSSWTSSREWTRYSSQKSAAITLSAGQRYYVEVLQKEGGGGDNLAVGWAKPGESTSAPSEVVPGARLSPWSSGNRAAIPSAPSGLTASVASSSQINLSWTDNASNEIGFIIERKTGSGGNYAQISTVSSNVTSYQDTGLTEGTLYYYRVCATNEGGSSAYSAEANATTMVAIPAAPSSLSAVAVSNNQINLAWTDNAANETGFKIERSLMSGSGFSEIATVSANVTSLQNTGLSPATVYFYRVRATNAGGDSDYSAEASAITGGLPSPWATQDIGTVGKVGSATYSNATFTIKGAGADVGGTADAFRFVHQVSSGDCEMKVRVASVSNTSAAAKAGVMIRESLNANAREAGVWVTPSSGIIFTYRSSSGGTTTTSTSTGKTAPYWVRVLRTGNSFSAYYGTNGTSWTQLGTTRTISMSTNAYMGMGVSSKVTNTLNTATIGNVTATP